ncbi:MAG TPA: CinA family protein [Acidimicrobiia bacterium]|nr:CinA family protein [Acidimicrobiia bacterium]
MNVPDRDAELVACVAGQLGGRTVACAESCTAGLVAQAFAAAPGSLDWFRGGVVAYQRGVKHRVLGVTPGPVVTGSAAEEMARGVAELLDADVAVSTTGAAGPDPLDGAAPGTVVVATYADGVARSRVFRFAGDPAAVCVQASTAALRELAARLTA